MSTFATPLNNVQTTLAAAYAPGSGTLVVGAGDGPLFGNPTPGAPVRVTVLASGAVDPYGRIVDPSLLAVYLATGRAGDVLTVGAPVEGTTDRAFAAGDTAAVLITAGAVADLNAAVNALEAGGGGSQYALLAGRPGGQVLAGGTGAGESLTLRSTTHATKGFIVLGTGASVGVNQPTPGAQVHIVAAGAATPGLIVDLAASPTANALIVRNSSAATLVQVDQTGALQVNRGGVQFPGLDVVGVSVNSFTTQYATARFRTPPGANGLLLDFEGDSQVIFNFARATDTTASPLGFAFGGAASSYWFHSTGFCSGGTSPIAQIEARSSATNRPILSLKGIASQSSPAIQIQQISSTATARTVGMIDCWFTNATDALRTARMTFQVQDSAGIRQPLAMDADGANPRLGFFAATPVVKPSGDIAAALSSLGLVTSPTYGASTGKVYPRPVTFLLAQGAPLSIGANKTNELVIERAGTITKAFIHAKTAPTGSAAIVDINVNGTSIWNTTQANRLQLAAGAVNGTQTLFDTVSVAEGDVLSIDVDQVGSTLAGQDVTVSLLLLIQNN